MWVVVLFRFPTFSPNLVSNKMSRFMKMTDNEGHRHLTLIFDLHNNFCTFIKWIPNYVFLVSISDTNVIYENI